MPFATFKSAALDFAQVVRGVDSKRILLTGNSLPRASAYNNATEGGSMRSDPSNSLQPFSCGTMPVL